MIWKLTILGNRCLHCWPQHISQVNNALEETSTFEARSNEPLTFQSLCQHPCITLTCCNTPLHYPLSWHCPVCLDPYRLVRGRNKWFEDDLAKMRERRWWEWPALCIKTKLLAGRSRACASALACIIERPLGSSAFISGSAALAAALTVPPCF